MPLLFKGGAHSALPLSYWIGASQIRL